MIMSTLEQPIDPAAAAAAAREGIWGAVRVGERTTLVDSPPGAGKSTLVREISRRAHHLAQVPIIVQTNEQADDMVRGLLADQRRGAAPVHVGRLHSGSYTTSGDLTAQPSVTFSKTINDMRDSNVIVSTAAKWATIGLDQRWPFAIIDEVYQMRSDALLPIGAMMESLLLVGDPGQLAPFTTADDTRFRGRPLSPLETAATTVLTTAPHSPARAPCLLACPATQPALSPTRSTRSPSLRALNQISAACVAA